jgi:TolA-binding protein
MPPAPDPMPKVLDSPLTRHLVMFSVMAFGIGVAWNALSADIRQHARELEAHKTAQVREMENFRSANTLAFTDVRTRLSAVESENVRDRERFYEMSNKLTEIQADLRFLRAQFERQSAAPSRP